MLLNSSAVLHSFDNVDPEHLQHISKLMMETLRNVLHTQMQLRGLLPLLYLRLELLEFSSLFPGKRLL